MSVATNPTLPKDGAIAFADGAGSPLTASGLYEDGDFQWSEITEGNADYEVFESRMVPYAARKTTRKYYELTATFHLVQWTHSTGNTILDIVRKTGAWASATSTSSTRGDLWTFSTSFTVEGTDRGSDKDDVITFKYCRATADVSEGIPTKVTLKLRNIPFASDHLTVV